MRRRLFVSIGLAAVFLGTFCAVAGAAPVDDEGTFQFRVDGTNGFRLLVFADYQDGKGGASVAVRRGGSSSYYGARSTDVDADGATVDFGSYGRLDVDFKQVSVRKKRLRGCSGFFRVRRGTFRGHFDFSGEGGYTEAAVERAAGSLTSGSVDCSGDGRTPNNRPKRRQVVLSSCVEDSGMTYFAFAARAGRPAYHVTDVERRRGRVSISRLVLDEQPAETFTYEQDLSAATLAPIAPFSGTGSFAGTELGGDLAVRFLGEKSATPLVPATAELSRERGLSASYACGDGTTSIVVFSPGKGGGKGQRALAAPRQLTRPGPRSVRAWTLGER